MKSLKHKTAFFFDQPRKLRLWNGRASLDLTQNCIISERRRPTPYSPVLREKPSVAQVLVPEQAAGPFGSLVAPMSRVVRTRFPTPCEMPSAFHI
jgi:hypothetical protein